METNPGYLVLSGNRPCQCGCAARQHYQWTGGCAGCMKCAAFRATDVIQEAITEGGHTHHLHYTKPCLKCRADERAGIVAYVRGESHGQLWEVVSRELRRVAAAIERGDHAS